MRVLLIEDELPAAKKLTALLREIAPDFTVLDICTGIKTSVNWLRANPMPNVIFMDIELTDGKSFEIFKQVDISCPVIFTTAYDEFAIKAIKLNALDYLLKPVVKQELVTAVEKTRENSKKGQHQANDYIALQKLVATLSKGGKPQRLAVNTLDTTFFIDLNNIVRIEGDSNYSHIYLADGKKITASRTLKEYDEILSGLGFFRVHKAHLVNLSLVNKYSKADGYIIMADNASIEVARDRKNELISALSIE